MGKYTTNRAKNQVSEAINPCYCDFDDKFRMP